MTEPTDNTPASANDRLQYEAVFGPVPTGRFVQLLTEDAWFRWLDPLSRLIVALDEWLEQTPPQADAGIALADEAAKLFRHTDVEFGERYRLALQQAPDAVLGQSQVVAALRGAPQSPADASGKSDAPVAKEPDASANEGDGA